MARPWSVSKTIVPESSSDAVLSVKLDHAYEDAVVVSYMTEGVTARPGLDFEHVEGTLTFAPGVTAIPLTVPIVGDALNEENERFRLLLDSLPHVHTHAHIRIADNDPLPAVSMGDAPAVTEGQTASEPAVFSISLSAPSGRALTVNYAIGRQHGRGR